MSMLDYAVKNNNISICDKKMSCGILYFFLIMYLLMYRWTTFIYLKTGSNGRQRST